MSRQPGRPARTRHAIVQALALCLMTGGAAVAELKEIPRLSPILTLCLRPEGEMDQTFTDAMTSEVGGLLESAGIATDWKFDHVPDPVFSIVVIRVRGSCSAAELPSGPPGPTALGWAHVSDGVVLPFCVLDCDRLLARLTPEVRGLPAHERNRLLGKAAARVVGHEVFHILTASREHSRNGITKAALTVSDLMQGDTVFSRPDIERIRQGPVCRILKHEKVANARQSPAGRKRNGVAGSYPGTSALLPANQTKRDKNEGSHTGH